MRVLVIDDNQDSAFLMCELVKLCGYEARFCTCPEASILVAREWQPQFVFLDLAMPSMDGYSLAPKLREAVNGAGLRIVLASGYVPNAALLAAAKIDGHMLKPVALARLKGVLAE
jgi:CheY-like chemotaxis protein